MAPINLILPLYSEAKRLIMILWQAKNIESDINYAKKKVWKNCCSKIQRAVLHFYWRKVGSDDNDMDHWPEIDCPCGNLSLQDLKNKFHDIWFSLSYLGNISINDRNLNVKIMIEGMLKKILKEDPSQETYLYNDSSDDDDEFINILEVQVLSLDQFN